MMGSTKAYKSRPRPAFSLFHEEIKVLMHNMIRTYMDRPDDWSFQVTKEARVLGTRVQALHRPSNKTVHLCLADVEFDREEVTARYLEHLIQNMRKVEAEHAMREDTLRGVSYKGVKRMEVGEYITKESVKELAKEAVKEMRFSVDTAGMTNGSTTMNIWYDTNTSTWSLADPTKKKDKKKGDTMNDLDFTSKEMAIGILLGVIAMKLLGVKVDDIAKFFGAVSTAMNKPDGQA